MSTSDEAQLVQLSKSWSKATNSRDRATLEELMAPEFVLHKWDNTRDVSRAVWFDVLLSHIEVLEFEQTNLTARVHGDTAMVTSSFPVMHTAFDGKTMPEIHGYFVDVWRRTNDRWQVVSRTSVDLPGRHVSA